jgi:hypothetical protein
MTSKEQADLIALGQHMENRSRFPVEELEKYRGQWIAWSLDGSRIVVHTDHSDVIYDLILQAGKDVARCVVEGIPSEDTVLGWGTSNDLAQALQRAKEADSR